MMRIKTPGTPRRNAEANRLAESDRPAHDWYRFVLSFPPHLVRDYLVRFELRRGHTLLDPFCGTGTTIVECKKAGIASIGVEGNPMAQFASRVKVDWSVDADGLVEHSLLVAEAARRKLADEGIDDDVGALESGQGSRRRKTRLRSLTAERERLLLANSISPLPLHKTLVLLECLEERRDARYLAHQQLALAKSLVNSISNLHFGPEVGVSPAKPDSAVVTPWLAHVQRMADDVRLLADGPPADAVIHHEDSRRISRIVPEQSIDAVITSPPYPNEKDYTRATRLESVLLGFIGNREELRACKRGLVRSNTRGVYRGDDDDGWIAGHGEIQRIAEAIERRRVELGKTSGFERLYHRVTKLYFGGMARHLSELSRVLRPGAQLAYVVGDQASYLQVMIRTGKLLAEIAATLGYEVVGIDLFRTRLATATKEQLREEVVVLRWPRKLRASRRE